MEKENNANFTRLEKADWKLATALLMGAKIRLSDATWERWAEDVRRFKEASKE